MAGRGMLFAEGPNACPFVALDSDRDRRAAEPDPRHRCYAEPTPAPRALPHQREFCLSPGFSRCPIFQDWAVRAAARPVPLRPPAESTPEAPPEQRGPEQLPAFGPFGTFAEPPPGSEEPAPAAATEREAAGDQPEPATGEPQPAATRPLAGDARPAPPPILPPYSPDAAGATGRAGAPAPIERIPSLPPDAPSADAPEETDDADAGPSDSPPPERARPTPERPPAARPPADRPAEVPPAAPSEPASPRAGRRWTEDWPPSASSAAAGAGAAAAGGASLGGTRVGSPRAGSSDAPEVSPAEPPDAAVPARRSSQIEVGRPIRRRRPEPAPPSRRDEWSTQRADLIPAWERERYAAYPGLRTRIGLGDSAALLDRLTRILGVVALVAVAIALLLLAPNFFAGVGGPVASPTPSITASPAGPTPSPSPTVTPEPTVSFENYVVRAGDSLTAIAVEFGLLPCQIMAANPAITDPNLIQIGQVIQIPPDDFAVDCAASPTP